MAFSRGPSIVTDGLVLALDAANHKSYPGSGTTLSDLTSNGNDFTINGSPTYTSSIPSYFNFTSGQITKYLIKNPFSHPTGDMSLECWVKFTSTSMTGAIVSYEASGAGNNNLLFFSNGTLLFYGPVGSISTTWSIPDTTNWYQIVRTRAISGGAETLYINGQSYNTMTLASGNSFTSGGSLVVGQEQDSVGGGFDSGQCFVGDFSCMKLYNRTLTATEVAQNYNAQKSRFGL